MPHNSLSACRGVDLLNDAIIFGEQLKRLAVLRHKLFGSLTGEAPYLRGRRDTQFARLQFLNQDRCADRIAVAFQLMG